MMIYRMPTTFACIAVTAAAPILLHGDPTRDCNPRVDLCRVSDAAYLPDEPAPEQHAPARIFARPVATATVSSLSGVIVEVPVHWQEGGR
jgi:hypothetical protein